MPADHILDDVLRQITNSLQNYSLQIGTFATRIALVMALLQVCLATYYAWGSIRTGPSLYALDLIRRILPAFVMLWLLEHVADWGNGFFDGYNGFASTLAGGAAITPSAIFNHGLTMVTTIAKARSLKMWLWGALSLEDLTFFVFCLIVIGLWAAMGWLMLFVLLEIVGYVVGGTLVVCYSPLQHGMGSSMSWIRQILSTGTKVIMLSLLMGGVILLANAWQDVLNTSTYGDYWETVTMVEAMVSFFVLYTIPGKVAALISVEGAGHSSHDDGAWHSAKGAAKTGAKLLV